VRLERDTGLIRDLEGVLAPERVLARPIDLVARSVDASIYRMIPKVVVRPRDLEEVRALFAYARRRRRHLTLRTAGTSLSGQAVTDDILVELAPFWKAYRVLDGGQRIWSQPGVVGGYLNRVLAPLRRRLGPDPASIDAAMIGGIVSNNSSGMCCGVAQNSYHTLDALHFMLADGTEIDTSRPEADEDLRRARPDLHAALLDLRDEVRADAALAARIRAKFARKQTMAYSLHALLDHDAPAQILAHLMVGAQGTLGFLADVTLRTVPEPPHRATALLYFADLAEAGAAVAPLGAAGAAALEIMDAPSLRSQADERHYPFPIGDRTAALLAEFRADDAAGLAAQVRRAEERLAGFRLLAPAAFTTDPAERDRHWHLRKGLFPSVGGMRPSGTAVVIEDVVVPVERLAEAITDLQVLYARHGFGEAITFGHARDGNLHFVFAKDFADPPTVRRYAAFMNELVEMVVGKYDGALKAEHGSGRNMAPFVRDEWGDRAYDVMTRIKELLDPDRILNPGVVLNDDPEVHLKDLKALPTISATADKCIECGFCEPRCPSRYLTLTPRQRIVVTRELERLSVAGDGNDAAREWREALLADFDYEGIATCSRDSMCSTSCPVHIDTGALIKETLIARHPPAARRWADRLAARYRWLMAAARLGLWTARVARAIPGGAWMVDRATGLLHALAPAVLPHLPRDMPLPAPAPPLPDPDRAEVAAVVPGASARVVYFPSCLVRMMGPLPGERPPSTPRAMVDVLQAAGYEVSYPADIAGLCCGMPFASKAFPEAAARCASAAAEALWTASEEGRTTVVTDASPCAGTLNELASAYLRQTGRTVRIRDFTAFWAREVLPRLDGRFRRPGRAVLHPTCTLVKMGGLPDLLAVARAHAEEAVVPPGAECCGFAGDRGFVVPELTRAATAREAAEVRALDGGASGGLYSTCRTCEIGMSRAVGRPYASIVHLVREALLGG
jgi:D-lactate dehydrogenase